MAWLHALYAWQPKNGGIQLTLFSFLALLCSQCVAALAEVTGIFMGDCGFILGTASCLHVSGDGGEGGHGLLAVQDSAGTVTFQSFWNIPVGQLMCSVSV